MNPPRNPSLDGRGSRRAARSGGRGPRHGQAASRDRTDRPDRPPRRGSTPDIVWIYGLHAVAAALDNPLRKRLRLVLTANAAETLADRLGKDILAAAERAHRAAIDALLPPGAVHQGAALRTRPLPRVALEDVIGEAPASGPAPLVILDQVTDPQNVGAVLRSAAAFGARAVILPERHAPDESGALAKAASGALESVPLVRVGNLARAMDTLRAAGWWTVGLDQEAEAALASLDAPDRAALVLGSEGAGLRRLTREGCDLLARLPMADRGSRGAVDSLNVSAAAAVALYELARRKS